MDDAMVDRLRAHAETRPVAIPDTEGEVLAALGRLDELLGSIAAWEEEPVGAGYLAAGPSWEAVRRLVSAVGTAEAEPPAQPVAPDGRYELTPLAWAIVERADLVRLGLAIQALGRGWALRHDEPLVETLVEAVGNDGWKPKT